MKKTLIIAAISLFAAYHLPTAAVAQDDIVDGVAAVVGRNIIKYSDVERSYAQIRLKQGAADAFNNRCAVLENLILSQLLVHKGEVDSVEITDDEINQYVEYYLKNDMRNYGTREALHEATGFTYEEKAPGNRPHLDHIHYKLYSFCDICDHKADKSHSRIFG